jgi:RNA-directed DNA polymerase
LEGWLKDMGLEMKPSKTRIAHTLETLEAEPPGFDFLGFEIRQYPVGKHHSGKQNGKRLGFKTLIRRESKKPSNGIEKPYERWFSQGRDFLRARSLGN